MSSLKESGHDEFAAVGDQGAMELGPHLLLGGARDDRCSQRAGRRFGRPHRLAHRLDLGRLFHHHRGLHHLVAVDHLQTAVGESLDHARSGALHRETGALTPPPDNQVGDLADESLHLPDGTRGSSSRSTPVLVAPRRSSPRRR